ncbi:hypothetical protein Nmel_007983, partial [Mimus melanotis]
MSMTHIYGMPLDIYINILQKVKYLQQRTPTLENS